MKFTKDGLPTLTPREMEVLQEVWEGFPNKHIAARLKISVKTVEAHRASLMGKLRVSSCAQLLRLAVQHKLVRG
jgi:DNA-binding NarL/FixJ family response regulator